MKKIIYIFIILLIFTSCASESVKDNHNNIMLSCNYYNEKLFLTNLSKASKYDVPGKVIAITVPHNECIMDMTASALETAKEYDYDSIVLLSINHKAKVGKMLLASADFNTTLGVVRGDVETKEYIKNSLIENVIEEYEIVEEDHSASVLMPYIKKYFPDTPVTTMLFTKRMTTNDIAKVSEVLYNLSQEKNILILGSMDFSHYQNYQDTAMYDEETLKLVNNFDTIELRQKDSKNLDAREALSIILEYAKLRGFNKVSTLEHRIVSNAPSSDDYGSYMVLSINEEE
ncbi:MAG: AmmeMemoRadiSam system protein B [Clostridia bacterium]|nr:AmmeMemoRadiSam system protein B [Clostridia bacterium]